MKKIEEMDEREIALAYKVFDFDYIDKDISDEELSIRNNIYNLFSNEIKESRDIILTVTSFPKYDIYNKIAFCLELVRQLAIDNYNLDNSKYIDIYEIIKFRENEKDTSNAKAK